MFLKITLAITVFLLSATSYSSVVLDGLNSGWTNTTGNNNADVARLAMRIL